MKNRRWMWEAAKSLIWFLQLGLSMVLPVVLCVLGAVFARQRLGWSGWIWPVAIVAGLVMGGMSFYDFARYMQRQADAQPKDDWSPKDSPKNENDRHGH